ncbi:snRNA-activating protein complex subunit 2 [Rhincodon typus]|uniref:snRNA-activating protein complex subunit 2 n=1 Tax=Rhincodon typus TaxID=259920 RepID=UPI00202DE32C|nr:snRNA-activating protein complex subunit 2 [Rhincodon typus]
MKPPVRLRAAPRRYGVESETESMDIDGEVAEWNPQEKRLLLRALKKQSASREPDLSSIESEVPGKTREQIAVYLEDLKVSSIRSVSQRNYLERLREKHLRQRQLRAPLQIWTELAEEMTGELGKVISAAFSQTLMIAATEPRCRASRAAPTDPTSQASGDGTLPGDSRPDLVSSAPPSVIPVTEGSAPSAGESQAPDAPIDFAKIYKYLSATARGSTLPQLSPFESAVILDLLMSLPDQIQVLNCQELWSHMNATYSQLTQTASSWHDQGPSQPARPVQTGPPSAQASVILTGQVQASGHNVLPAHLAQLLPAAQTHQLQSPHTVQPGQSKSTVSKAAVPALESDWPMPCPLNPFRLPVKLLVRSEAPTASQGPTADLGTSAPGSLSTAAQPSADPRPPASYPTQTPVQPTSDPRPPASYPTLTPVQPSADPRPPASYPTLTPVQPSADPRPPASDPTLIPVQPSADPRPPASDPTLTVVQPSADPRPPASDPTQR